VRILSSSSTVDGEDGVDDNDDDRNNDDDGDNDYNEGNNDAYGGTYGVGGSQRGGVMPWDPNYYATEDSNSSYNYSSGHDSYSRVIIVLKVICRV